MQKITVIIDDAFVIVRHNVSILCLGGHQADSFLSQERSDSTITAPENIRVMWL